MQTSPSCPTLPAIDTHARAAEAGQECHLTASWASVDDGSNERIATLVDDIMAQTHLLAFTMAMEATRTGRRARLVAVDAAMQLAQRSLEACEEIKDLADQHAAGKDIDAHFMARAWCTVDDISSHMRRLTAMVEGPFDLGAGANRR